MALNKVGVPVESSPSEQKAKIISHWV